MVKRLIASFLTVFFIVFSTGQALAAPNYSNPINTTTFNNQSLYNSLTQKDIFDREIPYFNLAACGPQNQDASSNGLQPGPIYILGDSITYGAKDIYEKKFKDNGWEPNIQAKGGRQIRQNGVIRLGGQDVNDGLSQLDKDQSYLQDTTNAIVIALGTNGYAFPAATFKSDVDQMIGKVKKYNKRNVPVFWVNVIDFRDLAQSQKANKIIKDELGTDGDIIDWYTEAKNNHKATFGEGVHPLNTADKQLLVDLVYESVSSKAAASGDLQVTGNLDKDVGASVFTDAEGYRSDSLRGTYSFAELSPAGTAQSDVTQQTATNLGKLKYKQRVAITYKDKTVVAQKLDIGQGGGKVKGKVRAIDLTFDKTAKALGINDPNNFLDVVHVKTVANDTPLGPVNSPTVLNSSSSNVQSTDPPVIVIDPGHSGSNITRTDPKTGLYDHDWSNTYETDEVYKISQQVKDKLESDGYKVILTKKGSNDNVFFRQRAEIANDAKADLAVSIHNNHQTSWDNMAAGHGGEVYAQVVGGYRQNKPGMGRGNKKVEFTNKAVADKSKKYSDIFASTRSKTEKHKVVVTVNSGFTGRSDIASGNLPMVQLFANVPWVYNEVGAPAGPMPKSQMDLYAQGIIDSVEKSIPANGTHDTSTNQNCTCSIGGDSGSTSDGNVNLSGSDNEEKVFNYLTGKGLSGAQAAGIVGNLKQESGVDPTSSGGYLAQWQGGRATALKALADKRNAPITSLAVQLDYLWAELTGSPDAKGNDYKSVLENIKKVNSPEEAAQVFSDQFEKPSIPMIENRKKYSREVFDKYGDGSGAAVNSAACSGSPDCNGASGSSAFLCIAKKFEGIYYQWGGGHISYSKFKEKCPDPSNPPNNKPTGGPAIDGGKSGNPSPCALDCSGLISMTVSEATGANYNWIVGNDGTMQGNGDNYWKKINIDQAKPGDIVTRTGHVEFVDHISGDKVYTFGTRSTGTKAGSLTMPKSHWSGGAWTWTGPGGNN